MLAKLIIFALSLGIVPISSYFLSRDYLWAGALADAFSFDWYAGLHNVDTGNTIYAALTAIFAANLVLVLYIVGAVREESRLRAREKQQNESKKDR